MEITGVSITSGGAGAEYSMAPTSGGNTHTYKMHPDIDLTVPANISHIASIGAAKKYFEIGDVINIPWTNYNLTTPTSYQFPFIVVDIYDCYDENGKIHKDAIWLMAKYTAPYSLPWDLAEGVTVNLETEPNALEGWYYWGYANSNYTKLSLSPGDPIPTTYTTIKKHVLDVGSGVFSSGNNQWWQSIIRQYLNSDAAKREGWWTSQHAADKGPESTYNNYPGWISGFTPEWKAIFKKVKVETIRYLSLSTVTHDVSYDKFFLPSSEQLFGQPGVSMNRIWPYWKQATGFSIQSNNATSARQFKRITAPTSNSGVMCPTRSAFRSGAGNIHSVKSNGAIDYTAVDSGTYYYLPCTVLY